MPALSMTEFLKFLQRYCKEHQVDESGKSYFNDEVAISRAYGDIETHIRVFLQDYAEEKALTSNAEKQWLQSIETDVRRSFDNPDELIDHIQKIATRPPFFDSARISLSAIAAFCNDYMSARNMAIREEQIKHAPF